MSNTGEMWDAVTRVGRLSHSITSGNGRMLSGIYFKKAARMGIYASLSDTLEAKAAEAMENSEAAKINWDSVTGKVVDDSG